MATDTKDIFNTCPECSGRVIRSKNREVCTICGLIIEQNPILQPSLQQTLQSCPHVRESTYIPEIKGLSFQCKRMIKKDNWRNEYLRELILLLTSICEKLNLLPHEKEEALHFFQDICNRVKHKEPRYRIKLLFSCVIVASSRTRRDLPHKKVYQLAEEMGYAFNMTGFREMLSKFKRLRKAYKPKSLSVRFINQVKQSHTKLFSQNYLQDKFEDINPKHCFSQFKKQLELELMSNISSFLTQFRLKSYNPQNYAAGIIALSIKRTADFLHLVRFITYKDFALVLKLHNFYSVREAVYKIREGLK